MGDAGNLFDENALVPVGDEEAPTWIVEAAAAYERSLWLARRIKAARGECWENAARGLARWRNAPADLLYVRGIAVWAMPFPHAWLQVGPTIVDPTLVLKLSEDELREEVGYFAVDTRTVVQVTPLVAQRALLTLHVQGRDLCKRQGDSGSSSH